MISSIIQPIIKPIISSIVSTSSSSGPIPMARYKFDETSGTTFVDSIGAVNGTYQGSINLNQTALNNDGGGSVEFIADNTSWGKITGFDTDEIITSFTISLWIKSAAATIAHRPILTALDTAGNDKGIVFLLADSANAYFPSINVKTASTWYTAVGTTDIRPDTTNGYLLTVTWDGSDIKIYTNGVLQDTQAVTGSIIGLDGTLYVGKDRFGGADFWQVLAFCDDLKIYPSTLTDVEILAEYNNTKP